VGDWPKPEILQKLYGYGLPASSDATALTVAGGLHTKSAYTEIVASTPFDSHGLIVAGGMKGIGSFDIAVGAAGYEQIIIPDYYQGFRISILQAMYFPLYIPGGTRIAARYQGNQTATAPKINVYLRQGDISRGFSLVETYGFITGTSRGLTVDPGSTAHTKGAWHELVASTGKNLRGFAIMLGDQAYSRSSNSCDWLVDLGIGAAGYENVFIPDWWCRYNYSAAACPLDPLHSPWFWLPIPAGSRLAVRAQAGINTATVRLIDIVLHAIV